MYSFTAAARICVLKIVYTFVARCYFCYLSLCSDIRRYSWNERFLLSQMDPSRKKKKYPAGKPIPNQYFLVNFPQNHHQFVFQNDGNIHQVDIPHNCGAHVTTLYRARGSSHFKHRTLHCSYSHHHHHQITCSLFV